MSMPNSETNNVNEFSQFQERQIKDHPSDSPTDKPADTPVSNYLVSNTSTMYSNLSSNESVITEDIQSQESKVDTDIGQVAIGICDNSIYQDSQAPVDSSQTGDRENSEKTKKRYFQKLSNIRHDKTKSKLERVGGVNLMKTLKEQTESQESHSSNSSQQQGGYNSIEKEIENFALPIVMELISKSKKNSPNHSRKNSIMLTPQLQFPTDNSLEKSDENQKVYETVCNEAGTPKDKMIPSVNEMGSIHQRQGNTRESSTNSSNCPTPISFDLKKKDTFTNISDLILYQKFLAQIGQSLGQYGCPLYRLEANLDRLSKCFGISASFAAFPGFIMIFFGESSNSNNETKVVKLQTTFDLQKLELVDALLDDVIRGKLRVELALIQLPLIKSLPPIYPWYITLFGYCISAMGVAPLAFNGGWRETWLSFFLGAFVYLFEQLGNKLPEFRNLVEFAVAVVVGFITTALSKYVCFGSVVLSSIVVLLPGMILTTGFIELMARSMIMGTVKALYALLVMLMLTFGVQVGQGIYTAIFESLGGTPHTLDISMCTQMSPYWWIVFFPVSMISLCILLNMPVNRWPLCILTSGIMFGTFLIFKNILNLNQLSTVASAFALGLSSNICDRLFGTPPFIFLLPATMILVPGSVGVRTLSALFDGSSSADLISRMLTTCLSIVVGLFMATFAVYPKGKKRSALLSF